MTKVEKFPKVNVDILVVKNNKFLLGLLTKEWNCCGKQVWGVPGSDINFGERIGDAVQRHILNETGCTVKDYKIICTNANYALGNHYIGIGVLVEIEGKPRVMMPKEFEKWRWFDADSMPDNLFPPAKNLIECYLKNKFCVSE